jgi:hypothetical protein
VALHRRPRAKREPLHGFEEPRIWTKPLRPLTAETSLGFECIDFSENVLEIALAPWERWLFIHLLELLPNGNLRFRTALVLVARQNGKSMMSVILALFFMYVLGKRLVLGTAQALDVAEDIWEEAVALIESIPELDEQKRKVVEGNGKKTVILKTGERYRVKAANRRAARGLSGNLVLVDDLREHQTWDAWGALTKTTMARSSSLVLALSNAGDASSIVLRWLRALAHEALGDPDGIVAAADPASLLPGPEILDEHGNPYEIDDEEEDGDSLAIFEWSAPPGLDKWDRLGWAQANPSCGYTELDERAIAGACRTDPEWLFRTEVLCQWPDGGMVGPIDSAGWSASTDPDSKRAKGARVKACIDVSADGTMTTIGVCTDRKGGGAHVEIVARRPGTDWVEGWIFDKSKRERREWRYTGQGRGAPVSALIASLKALTKRGEPLLDVTLWQGDSLPQGHVAFLAAIMGRSGGDEIDDEIDVDDTPHPRVFHRPSPILDVAAGVGVTKTLGDGGWVLDRVKSPVDVSGLMTVIGAYWLWTQPEEEVVRSAYERRGLETV